jgi:hypothetical protein
MSDATPAAPVVDKVEAAEAEAAAGADGDDGKEEKDLSPDFAPVVELTEVTRGWPSGRSVAPATFACCSTRRTRRSAC